MLDTARNTGRSLAAIFEAATAAGRKAGAANAAGAVVGPAINPIDNDSDNKKRTHRCSFPNCHKVYPKSSHLKAHQRTHTGKPIHQFTYQDIVTFSFFLIPKVLQFLMVQLGTNTVLID